MLNYIWAGLIILSFVFALGADIGDLRKDTYRNGKPLPLTLHFPDSYNPDAREIGVDVRLDSVAFATHYGTTVRPESSYTGVLVQSREGRELRFAKDVSLPEPLASIRTVTSERDNDLRGPVELSAGAGDSVALARITFPTVRFVKLVAITRAAFDFAKTAVTLAFGLIGVLALWLGLLRLAEKSGLVNVIVRLFQPLLRPLFPEIPRDHPALGMIVLNLSANVLGLGNAATPMGLKAMEELQKLNPVKDTATNSMVMLLAINTASVQLVPPVLLVAIMGLQINQLFFSITLVTALSLVFAIIVTKFLERLRVYRESDPGRQPLSDVGSG